MPFLLLLSFVGCVDPFETPNSPSNSNVLVVEGRIGKEQTEIKLTRSANLDTLEIVREKNAQVRLENEAGTLSLSLVEQEDGLYSVSQSLTFGERYRIRISTADDETYLSAFVPLLSVPEISEVHLEYDSATTQLDITLSTGDPEGKTRYYRWEYEETWEYRSVRPSSLEYTGEELVPRAANIRTCWVTRPAGTILLETSISLDEDVISRKLINREMVGENEKFRIGYSILIRQYALTSDEFEFWSLLKKNTETFGTLFDPQPSQLKTNLTCISTPDKLVVGYISASAVAQQRVTLERSDFPRDIPEFQPNVGACDIITVPFDPLEIALEFTTGDQVPLGYLIGFSGIEGVFSAAKACVDCREAGGTTTRPDFWF